MSQVILSVVKMLHLMIRSWLIAANITVMNFYANMMNSNAKATNSTNSIAKVMNSITNGPNLFAKPCTLNLINLFKSILCQSESLVFHNQ